jgi:hypothetical protein
MPIDGVVSNLLSTPSKHENTDNRRGAEDEHDRGVLDPTNESPGALRWRPTGFLRRRGDLGSARCPHNGTLLD